MLAPHHDTLLERALKRSRTGDALLLGIAGSTAAVEEGVFHWNVATAYLVMAMAMWLVVSRTLGQYSAANGRGLLGDVALTLVMIAGVVAPIALVSLVLPEVGATLHPGRAAWRSCPRRYCGGVHRGPAPLATRPGLDVLVVGIGPLGRLTGEAIRERKAVRGCSDTCARRRSPIRRTCRRRCSAASKGSKPTLRQCAVDEVYFASAAREHGVSVQAAIKTCETLGVPFALPVCEYQLTRARPATGGEIAGGYAHFLHVKAHPVQLAFKRLFDIVSSATALALLSPLILAVAILVKLTSRGPVLFRQERVGLHGRKFHMLKFRSMVVNAEELKAKLMAHNEQSGPVFKMARDPRITGDRALHPKYSIDELPQLINVLRGEMSVVGPRPAGSVGGGQVRGVAAAPPLGASGAHVRLAGQRSKSRSRSTSGCTWTCSTSTTGAFAGDLGLILRTIPVVLTGRGAS